MLTITSNLFEANRFMSEIEIIHLRSINDKNDEYIKQLINNGCKYINLLASSEYLIQMISVVEKNNLANFGWFNVFGSDYQIDKTTGELS
jgi:chaperonin GroEL (HSP60 family)